MQFLLGSHEERGVEVIANDGRHLLGEGGGGAFGKIADGLGVGEVVAVVPEGGIGISSSSSSKAWETGITNGGNEQHVQKNA
jgi:hypothetical protein